VPSEEATITSLSRLTLISPSAAVVAMTCALP
jgi:hypothetical protein